MPSSFSENLRIYNAEQFKKSVSDVGPTNIYLTFGRQRPWANDSAPPQANSSVESTIDIWNNMIGAKLISGGDIRHGIPRNNWTANTSYSIYDHRLDSTTLFSRQFYVLTSQWGVYKCLSNSNGGISTVEPTQIFTNTAVEESDGYVWKYMYTLSAEERLRFLTSAYMPVKTVPLDNNTLQWQVQDDAVDGAIEAVIVESGGSGYSDANTITVTISGDGLGATAIPRINSTTNTISTIAITSPGSGYTYATVEISDINGGTDASAVAMISPPGGHGSDALHELGGSYLILNPRLRTDEGGVLPIDNEFRQIAIIQDPLEHGTSNIATNSAYNQTLRLTVSESSTNYIQDEIVYQGGSLATATFTGVVETFDTTNNIVSVTNTTGTVTSDVLIGANTVTSRFVESVTVPGLESYTGILLYTDNIVPITRAADQTEDFKICIRF